MYYEEEIIDGVLCYRDTPDGKWIPHTLKAMTDALTEERTQNAENHAGWMAADAKLREIQGILSRGA